jgi:hypothetical protein
MTRTVLNWLSFVLAFAIVLALIVFASCERSEAQQLSNAPSKVIDKKFVLLSLAGKGAMTADYITTVRNLDFGYPESNPLLGRYPSRPRLVATGLALDFGLDVVTYQLKRRHVRWWWAPRVAQIGANSWMAARNAGISRTRYRYDCTNPALGCVPIGPALSRPFR